MFDSLTESLSRRRGRQQGPLVASEKTAEEAKRNGLAPPAPYVNSEENPDETQTDPNQEIQGMAQGAAPDEAPTQEGEVEVREELMRHVLDSVSESEYNQMKEFRPRSLGERAKMTLAADKFEK